MEARSSRRALPRGRPCVRQLAHNPAVHHSLIATQGLQSGLQPRESLWGLERQHAMVRLSIAGLPWRSN